MKKLGKLSINQSKLLENEELVNLRGGYGSYYFPGGCDGYVSLCYCVGSVGEWLACTSSPAGPSNPGEWCASHEAVCYAT